MSGGKKKNLNMDDAGADDSASAGGLGGTPSNSATAVADDPSANLEDDQPLFANHEMADDAGDESGDGNADNESLPAGDGDGEASPEEVGSGADNQTGDGEVEADLAESTPADPLDGNGDGDGNGAGDEQLQLDDQDNVDPEQMQQLADQLTTLDENSLSALIRGMPDESRESFCSLLAGTLSDQQLSKCGLSKAMDMGDGDGDGDGDGVANSDEGLGGEEMGGATTEGTPVDQESFTSSADADGGTQALQAAMDKAKPEKTPGSMSMSQAGATDTTKTIHPHSKELAELKAQQWVDRAKAVHSKNNKVITTNQLEAIEEAFQGAKSLSLLDPKHGDLAPLTILITMGERMVNGDEDLLKVQTVNMSLAGAEDGKGSAKPAKKPDSRSSGGFDREQAEKLAEESFGKKQAMCAAC